MNGENYTKFFASIYVYLSYKSSFLRLFTLQKDVSKIVYIA